MKLFKCDSRTNNHHYCNYKLHTHQSLNQRPLLTARLPSLEGQQRTERRHIECRKRACQATDSDNTEQHKQQGLPIELQSNILLYKHIKKR